MKPVLSITKGLLNGLRKLMLSGRDTMNSHLRAGGYSDRLEEKAVEEFLSSLSDEDRKRIEEAIK